MLTQLHIKDFTIIEKLDIDFHTGMTVLTGETGAGKSIMIDALELALGARADSRVIRHGVERCEITATFDLSDIDAAQAWLQDKDLDSGDEVILRRIVTRDGRSRCSINGTPCPQQVARELSMLLVNIHGQHKHQSLLKPDLQRDLLDGFAGLNSKVDAIKSLHSQWRQTQDEIARLQGLAGDGDARHELLRYQVLELNALDLSEDELETLHQEHSQLTHAGQMIEDCGQALAALSEASQGSALETLSTADGLIQKISEIDDKVKPIYETIQGAVINVQEASHELQHYLDTVSVDPERLSQVEARLNALYDVARKHHIKPEELPSLQTRIVAELQEAEQAEEGLKAVVEHLEKIETEYKQAAKALTQARTKNAKKLEREVTDRMQALGMKGGRFEIRFVPHPDQAPSLKGAERIEFLVSTNPGQPVHPLNKVASGGELSRIGLAIQVITAQRHNTPTFIFDEVDVGIGGKTAEIVGQLLRSLGESSQALCVTHLPQVAALAHHHIQVTKDSKNNTTLTRLQALNPSQRIHEIARMLGGIKITDQTLAHAKEMLGHA